MKVLIVIVALFFIYQQWFVTDAAAELNEQHDAPVILYATDWCGYCKKTRTILRQKGVSYKEFDIEKSAEAQKEFKQLGGHGVPLLLIEGEVIKGFNQPKILELVKGL